MNTRPRIVILGGGFAGLILARKLVQNGVAKREADITIVDKSTMHVYTPWLYEVSSGYLSRKDRRKERCELYTSATLSYDGIPGYTNVRFRHEIVTKVDPEEKTVHLADGLTLTYDILVVALGSEANFFGISGFPQYCYPLKSAADAVTLERAIHELFVFATPESPKQLTIIGGGATGVELTGELMMAAHFLVERGELLPNALKIALIDRKGPLVAFPSPLSALATHRLKKLGVNVMTGLSVLEAHEHGLLLKDEKGNAVTFPSDLTVWSGGVKPASVLQQFGLPLEQKGRIVIDQTFAVSRYPGVFALGDCAAMMNTRMHEMEPMTAQTAVSQAKWLAKNITAMVRGQSLKPYPFRQRWDVLIAVGGRYGVGSLGGMVVTGFLVFLLRRVTDLRYFMWILPLRHAWMKWLKGVTLYNKND